MIKETSTWKGTVKVTTRYKDGRIETEVIKNRIMDVALNEIIRVLEGEGTNLELKYMAFGTSNTAIANNQTQLGAEIERVPRTFIENTETGIVETRFILRFNEANEHIREIGFFCGDATVTPNSGTMLSRILWDKNKNENMEFVFERTDEIRRG